MDEILARIALFSGSKSVIPSAQKTVKATEKLSARQITEDSHRSRRVNTESNGVGVLCFSKDRPFQLEQFLISSSSFIAVERRQIKVVVLYSPGSFQHTTRFFCAVTFVESAPLCTHLSTILSIRISAVKKRLVLLLGKFDHLYKGVFARHPHVIPVEENTDEGFGEAFLKSINLIYEAVSPGGSICFCVDDLIFFDDINLRYSETSITTLLFRQSLFEYGRTDYPLAIYIIFSVCWLQSWPMKVSNASSNLQIYKSSHLTMTTHIIN